LFTGSTCPPPWPPRRAPLTQTAASVAGKALLACLPACWPRLPAGWQPGSWLACCCTWIGPLACLPRRLELSSTWWLPSGCSYPAAQNTSCWSQASYVQCCLARSLLFLDRSCVLDSDGTPVLLYTGVRLRSNVEAGPLPPPEHDLGMVWVESQLAAVPEDPGACLPACLAACMSVACWTPAECINTTLGVQLLPKLPACLLASYVASTHSPALLPRLYPCHSSR
jgi:hypothetical protein